MELNAKKCVMVIDEALPLVLLQILLALWELRLKVYSGNSRSGGDG